MSQISDVFNKLILNKSYYSYFCKKLAYYFNYYIDHFAI